MVKLQGPGLSTGAAGNIGPHLAYAATKGRHYLKYAPTPRNPRTELQTGHRSFFPFLTDYWHRIAPGLQDNWADLAAQRSLAYYQAYLRYNLRRWAIYQWPRIEPKVDDTTPTTDVVAFTADQYGRGLRITVHLDNPNLAWGFALHHRYGAYPTYAKPEIIWVHRYMLNQAIHHNHPRLLNGIHMYRLTLFSTYGAYNQLPNTAWNFVTWGL